MTPRAEKMLKEIDEKHDWRRGRVYGGSGTQMSSTDECRICGLERRWLTDSQNGVDEEYTFQFRGAAVSLREAAVLDC